MSLDYIESGAALSPAELEFGTVAIDMMSLQQKITLENCSQDTIVVSVIGLENVMGGVNAWNIQPSVIEKELGRNDQLEIFVRFAPNRGLHHEAKLRLRVAGESRFVKLSGDATGYVPDPQSLYGCACDTGGSPWGALPFASVLLLVLRRRRRRPELSGRIPTGSS